MIFKKEVWAAIFNGIFYLLVWSLCVYLAGKGLDFAAAFIGFGFTCLHLRWVFLKNRPIFYCDLAICIFILCFAFFLETFFIKMHFLHYFGDVDLRAPIWLISLYCTFGSTLNHSTIWLNQSPKAAFVLGMIGGPMNYRAGAAFHAVTILPPETWHYALLAICWGPFLFIVIRANLFFRKQFLT